MWHQGTLESGADTPDCNTDLMPVVSEEVSICSECEHDLEHCHGTAIIHLDASYDCSEDPDCHLAVEEHLFAAWEQDATE